MKAVSLHPTAIVHPGAEIGPGAVVGPYAVIGEGVVIGAGTVIGPHVVVHDNVTLGRDNRLAAHAVIGCQPQDRAYRGEPTRVVVGDGNLIGEFASVERATGDDRETRIGNQTFIMSGARVTHNCWIGDEVVIVAGTHLGGWVRIEEHAYIGGMAGVHQFVHIGRLAMVAGLSGARQDVPPYVMVAGFRARAVGLNRVGLERHGIPLADRQALRRAYRIFFRSGLTVPAALQALEAEIEGSEPVRHFVEFIRAARERDRGIVRWQNQTES